MPGSLTEPEAKRHLNALVQGFEKFGYIVGKDILIEYRPANRKIKHLPDLAGDLAKLGVSAIVAVGTTAIAGALKTTKTIPIIMISGGNPVGRGFVKTLSAPAGNVTGLSSSAQRDEGKRVELLKDIFPQMFRVMLLNADHRPARVKDYLKEAAKMDLGLEAVNAFTAEELDQAFVKIAATGPDALITVRNSFTIQNADRIINFTAKQRLPTMYESREFVEKGGLMSFGVDYTASWRRAAYYVDKIIKGTSPSVLPVEPPQFEFVINLRTAHRMLWKIPPQILLEANEVIR